MCSRLAACGSSARCARCGRCGREKAAPHDVRQYHLHLPRVLGGSQGAIGWWMVKSGVDTSEGWVDPNQRKEIRVSPYRLATHLVSEV